MPSLTLDRVWLHDTDNLANYLTFFSADRGDQRARTVDVRTYAGGRNRAVTRVSRRQQLAVRAVNISAATLEQLDDWTGHLLMFRDKPGRLVFGVYAALDVTDWKDGAYDAAFSFVEVTHSIEV